MGDPIMLTNTNHNQAKTGEEMMSEYISTQDANYALTGFSAGAQPTVADYVSPDSYQQTRKRKPVREEAGLIDRLKAGDERALEAIFNLYSTRLYNVAHRILGDVADAQEV